MQRNRGNRRAPGLCVAVLGMAMLAGPAAGGGREDLWLREIEVTRDREQDGQVDMTVRLLPSKTHACDKVVVECIYHQEFPWENVKGEKYTKIHEPVRFTYRRSSVRFVNDLDHYISFRLPLARERLELVYGRNTFNRAYPVTVPRICIKGMADGKALWSFEVPASGKHDIAERLREEAKRREEREKSGKTEGRFQEAGWAQ